MRRTTLILLLAAAGLAAGCGDSRPTAGYKQGKYQGKADTDPWVGEAFKGDKAAWEHAIRQRNQAQNEYLRMGNAPTGGKL